MNKELELEAAQYAEDEIKDRGAKNDKLICMIDFMAGATSKYAEKQKLEFAISLLLQLRGAPVSEIDNKVFELEQKLSEL